MKVIESIYKSKRAGQKALAILLDPDKLRNDSQLNSLLDLINHSEADYVLVGGSLVVESNFQSCLQQIRKGISKPIILFPGSPAQVSNNADAILFLSLISGRNADLLIGQHVQAAPILKKMDIETIATGYMLVDSGRPTTASYISQTFPLPWDKPDIAVATAVAGEMLGLKCLYLDGGSGAMRPISANMIKAVSEAVSIPIIVGGGIRSDEEAREAWQAGADLVVVGTAIEDNPDFLFDLSKVRKQLS